MKKRYLSVIAFGIITLIASCKKGDTGPAGTTGATGPAGPSYTGAITGHVDLYDEFGTEVLTGRNSAQLSLNGATAISPDATGLYFFGGVSTGDYSIAATCTGYGATMINKFQFLGDTLNRDVKLSAIPSFAMTTFTAYHNAGVPADSLVFTYTPDNRARECIVFANNTSSVDGTPSNHVAFWTHPLAANTMRSALLIPAQDLYDAGFTSGNTVYYAAYSYVVNDVSVYEDFATGRNVFNAINNPITGSATAP